MNKIKVLFFIIVIAMISVSFSCSNGADESGEDTNEGNSSSEKPNSNPEELSIILQPVEVATNTTLTINTSITTSGNVTKVVYKKNGSENAKTLLADTEAIDITENVKTTGKFVISATSEESGNGIYTIAASDDIGCVKTVQIAVNQFDFTPPDLINSLSANYSDIEKTVTLNWTNPVTTDFDHVEIIYTYNDGNTDSQKSSAELVRNASTKVFSVKAGNEASAITYKYFIYSVDGLGNKSLAVVKEVSVIRYQFHETVEYLHAGTDGTAGITGTYVLFGDWPQTIKANNIEINTTQTMTKGGFTYYLGSDQNWYVECVENAYADGYTYSDGTSIAKKNVNSSKYFKVEPIKWRVLNPNPVDGEKKVLLAEKCLTANIKFSNALKNNYADSDVRKYLNCISDNTGFLKSAFTTTAINKIADTLVKNDLESTTDTENNFICDDTNDKILLLSAYEIVNSAYGFSSNKNSTDNTRIREGTDYAKANYLASYNSWFLRSPSKTMDQWCWQVKGNGTVHNNISCSSNERGIVPALCLK